jgi:hypothetical protein
MAHISGHGMKLRMLRLAAAFGALQFAVVAAGMDELDDAAMQAVTGQALLVSDKLNGVANSNHTFYRMALDVELLTNMTIDRLQLGCGGFNDAVVNNACDLDLEYVTLMGRGAGQSGAPGSGTPADSYFKMTRPYIELAVKNDGDPTRREIIGFKIGAQTVDGFMGVGRYLTPGTAEATAAGCTNATDGQGAYYCHRGANRISGYLGAQMSGDVFGCFGLFGCTPNGNIYAQDRLASFDHFVQAWGTRMNRIQTELNATSNPDVTLGLTLNVASNVNESLRFLHGFAVDPSDPAYAADDFFMSFQREPVRYPTFNKSSSHSNTANPGWWLNIPMAQVDGLTSYNVAGSGANLFVAISMEDADIGQRPADNCYGSLKFC